MDAADLGIIGEGVRLGTTAPEAEVAPPEAEGRSQIILLQSRSRRDGARF